MLPVKQTSEIEDRAIETVQNEKQEKGLFNKNSMPALILDKLICGQIQMADNCVAGVVGGGRI